MERHKIDRSVRDDMVGALARLAMHDLDVWLVEAERALLGRYVTRTSSQDRAKGETCRITALTVAIGASGHHLFITAPALGGGENDLLELDVSCRLVNDPT